MEKAPGMIRKDSKLKIKLNSSKLKYFEGKQNIKDTLQEIKIQPKMSLNTGRFNRSKLTETHKTQSKSESPSKVQKSSTRETLFSKDKSKIIPISPSNTKNIFENKINNPIRYNFKKITDSKTTNPQASILKMKESLKFNDIMNKVSNKELKPKVKNSFNMTSRNTKSIVHQGSSKLRILKKNSSQERIGQNNTELSIYNQTGSNFNVYNTLSNQSPRNHLQTSNYRPFNTHSNYSNIIQETDPSLRASYIDISQKIKYTSLQKSTENLFNSSKGNKTIISLNSFRNQFPDSSNLYHSRNHNNLSLNSNFNQFLKNTVNLPISNKKISNCYKLLETSQSCFLSMSDSRKFEVSNTINIKNLNSARIKNLNFFKNFIKLKIIFLWKIYKTKMNFLNKRKLLKSHLNKSNYFAISRNKNFGSIISKNNLIINCVNKLKFLQSENDFVKAYDYLEYYLNKIVADYKNIEKEKHMMNFKLFDTSNKYSKSNNNNFKKILNNKNSNLFSGNLIEYIYFYTLSIYLYWHIQFFKRVKKYLQTLEIKINFSIKLNKSVNVTIIQNPINESVLENISNLFRLTFLENFSEIKILKNIFSDNNETKLEKKTKSLVKFFNNMFVNIYETHLDILKQNLEKINILIKPQMEKIRTNLNKLCEILRKDVFVFDSNFLQELCDMNKKIYLYTKGLEKIQNISFNFTQFKLHKNSLKNQLFTDLKQKIMCLINTKSLLIDENINSIVMTNKKDSKEENQINIDPLIISKNLLDIKNSIISLNKLLNELNSIIEKNLQIPIIKDMKLDVFYDNIKSFVINYETSKKNFFLKINWDFLENKISSINDNLDTFNSNITNVKLEDVNLVSKEIHNLICVLFIFYSEEWEHKLLKENKNLDQEGSIYLKYDTGEIESLDMNCLTYIDFPFKHQLIALVKKYEETKNIITSQINNSRCLTKLNEKLEDLEKIELNILNNEIEYDFLFKLNDLLQFIQDNQLNNERIKNILIPKIESYLKLTKKSESPKSFRLQLGLKYFPMVYNLNIDNYIFDQIQDIITNINIEKSKYNIFFYNSESKFFKNLTTECLNIAKVTLDSLEAIFEKLLIFFQLNTELKENRNLIDLIMRLKKEKGICEIYEMSNLLNFFKSNFYFFIKTGKDTVLSELENLLDEKISKINIYLKRKFSFFDILVKTYPRLAYLDENKMQELLDFMTEVSWIGSHNLTNKEKYYEKINYFYKQIHGYSIQFEIKKDMIIGVHDKISNTLHLFNKLVLKQSNDILNIFSELENEIKATLQSYLLNSLKSFSNKEFIEWILDNPFQIVFCNLNLIFVNEISQIFYSYSEKKGEKNSINILSRKDKSAKQDLDNIVSRYNSWIEILIRQLDEKIGDKLHLHNVLLTIQNHKNILEFLIKNKVYELDSYEWLKLIRHNWNSYKKEVVIECGGWSINQHYNFMPSINRVILSPQTEKMFLFFASCFREKSSAIIKVNSNHLGYYEIFRDFAFNFWIETITVNLGLDNSNFEYVKKIFDISTVCNVWLYLENICSDDQNLIFVSKMMQIVQQEIILNELKKNNPVSGIMSKNKMFCAMGCLKITGLQINDSILKSSSRISDVISPDFKFYINSIVNLFIIDYPTSFKNLITHLINVIEVSLKEKVKNFAFDFYLLNIMKNRIFEKFYKENNNLIGTKKILKILLTLIYDLFKNVLFCEETISDILCKVSNYENFESYFNFSVLVKETIDNTKKYQVTANLQEIPKNFEKYNYIELSRIITTFKNSNEEIFQNVDFNLYPMVYGIPGCGKTLFIKKSFDSTKTFNDDFILKTIHEQEILIQPYQYKFKSKQINHFTLFNPNNIHSSFYFLKQNKIRSVIIETSSIKNIGLDELLNFKLFYIDALKPTKLLKYNLNMFLSKFKEKNLHFSDEHNLILFDWTKKLFNIFQEKHLSHKSIFYKIHEFSNYLSLFLEQLFKKDFHEIYKNNKTFLFKICLQSFLFTIYHQFIICNYSNEMNFKNDDIMQKIKLITKDSGLNLDEMNFDSEIFLDLDTFNFRFFKNHLIEDRISHYNQKIIYLNSSYFNAEYIANLYFDSRQSVLLYGESGSGKTFLLKNFMERKKLICSIINIKKFNIDNIKFLSTSLIWVDDYNFEYDSIGLTNYITDFENKTPIILESKEIKKYLQNQEYFYKYGKIVLSFTMEEISNLFRNLINKNFGTLSSTYPEISRILINYCEQVKEKQILLNLSDVTNFYNFDFLIKNSKCLDEDRIFFLFNICFQFRIEELGLIKKFDSKYDCMKEQNIRKLIDFSLVDLARIIESCIINRMDYSNIILISSETIAEKIFSKFNKFIILKLHDLYLNKIDPETISIIRLVTSEDINDFKSSSQYLQNSDNLKKYKIIFYFNHVIEYKKLCISYSTGVIKNLLTYNILMLDLARLSTEKFNEQIYQNFSLVKNSSTTLISKFIDNSFTSGESILKNEALHIFNKIYKSFYIKILKHNILDFLNKQGNKSDFNKSYEQTSELQLYKEKLNEIEFYISTLPEKIYEQEIIDLSKYKEEIIFLKTLISHLYNLDDRFFEINEILSTKSKFISFIRELQSFEPDISQSNIIFLNNYLSKSKLAIKIRELFEIVNESSPPSGKISNLPIFKKIDDAKLTCESLILSVMVTRLKRLHGNSFHITYDDLYKENVFSVYSNLIKLKEKLDIKIKFKNIFDFFEGLDLFSCFKPTNNIIIQMVLPFLDSINCENLNFNNAFNLPEIHFENWVKYFFNDALGLLSFIQISSKSNNAFMIENFKKISGVNSKWIYNITKIIEGVWKKYRVLRKNECLNTNFFFFQVLRIFFETKPTTALKNEVFINLILEKMVLSINNKFFFSILLTLQLMVDSFELSQEEYDFILNFISENYEIGSNNSIKFKNGYNIVKWLRMLTDLLLRLENNDFLDLDMTLTKISREILKSVEKNSNENIKDINFNSYLNLLKKNSEKILFYLVFLEDQSVSFFKFLINNYMIPIYSIENFKINHVLKQKSILPFSIKSNPSINLTNFLCSLAAYYEIEFLVIRELNFKNTIDINTLYDYKYIIDFNIENQIDESLKKGKWLLISNRVEKYEFLKILENIQAQQYSASNKFKIFFDLNLMDLTDEDFRNLVENFTTILNVDANSVDDLEAAHDVWVNVLEENILTKTVMDETHKDFLSLCSFYQNDISSISNATENPNIKDQSEIDFKI